MFGSIAEKYLHDGTHYVKVFKKKLKPITDSDFIQYLTKDHIHIVLSSKVDELKKYLYQQYLVYLNNKQMESSFEFDDEVDFVRKKNEEMNLFEVKASGLILETNGKKKIIERLKQEAINYNRSIDTEFLKVGMITGAIEIVADNIRKEKLEAFRNKVKYNPEVEVDWNELIAMIKVKKDGLTEEHIKAFKHIVWQIKRKLNNLDTTWHLALILHGKQGCGKSEFLKKFFSVLDELYLLIDGEDIADRFNAHMFENNFVGNLDELTKLNDASMEMVKAFITRESTTERKMFSQMVSEYKQNLTIVGSSNRPINKVITDFTGMRRFWQMDIDKGVKTMDFKKIEQTDFLKFWQAIDENGNGFYSTNDEKMLEYQEKFKAVPPVQEFIETYGYTCESGYENEWIEVARVYDEWKDFCKKYNYKPFTINAFKGSLTECGFELAKRQIDRKQKWYCEINKEEEEF